MKTKRELYPLTSHIGTHGEFVHRYNVMRLAFAESSVGATTVPGGPDAMDFSGALLALKAGHHVTRAAWAGQGLYVTLQDGYPDGIAVNANTAAATGLLEGTTAAFAPYLLQHRPQNWMVSQGEASPIAHSRFVHWTPGTDDVLADDWQTVARPDPTVPEPERTASDAGSETPR